RTFMEDRSSSINCPKSSTACRRSSTVRFNDSSNSVTSMSRLYSSMISSMEFTILFHHFGVDLCANVGDELVQRPRAHVGVLSMPHRNCAGFRLAVAHHEHVGDFRQLRFTNLEV